MIWLIVVGGFGAMSVLLGALACLSGVRTRFDTHRARLVRIEKIGEEE